MRERGKEPCAVCVDGCKMRHASAEGIVQYMCSTTPHHRCRAGMRPCCHPFSFSLCVQYDTTSQMEEMLCTLEPLGWNEALLSSIPLLLVCAVRHHITDGGQPTSTSHIGQAWVQRSWRCFRRHRPLCRKPWHGVRHMLHMDPQL
jgi:hypothetical protein